MGAASFTTYQPGADPAEAFRAAVSRARHERGHDSDMATIAGKDGYTVIIKTTQPYDVAHALAQELIAADDNRIRGRSGPAGAIAVEDPTRTQLVSHGPLRQRGDLDADPLHQITESARAAGLISTEETVTAIRRYDHACITLTINKDSAAPTASTEPDGWLFFGWASE